MYSELHPRVTRRFESRGINRAAVYTAAGAENLGPLSSPLGAKNKEEKKAEQERRERKSERRLHRIKERKKETHARARTLGVGL